MIEVEESRGALFSDVEEAVAAVRVMEGAGWRLRYAMDFPNGSILVRLSRPGPRVTCCCPRCVS